MKCFEPGVRLLSCSKQARSHMKNTTVGGISIPNSIPRSVGRKSLLRRLVIFLLMIFNVYLRIEQSENL